MPKNQKQKIYCYVDETGQDTSSEIFIVVAIVSDQEQEALRRQLKEIELLAKIGRRKWHGTQFKRNKKYFQLVLKNQIGKVYFCHYQKPVAHFEAVLQLAKEAILKEVQGDYKSIIYVDGIDKKQAVDLTKKLRQSGIKTERVRTVRDESEPLIRLADRWAGCIRKAYENNQEAKIMFKQAKRQKYLQIIKE